MTHEDEIFGLLNQLSTRLTNIEKAINTIAVQEEKISSLKIQVNGMWKKYDDAFGPGGTLSKMQTWQATCPKKDIEKTLARQWKVITLVLALNGLVFGKAFGLFG